MDSEVYFIYLLKSQRTVDPKPYTSPPPSSLTSPPSVAFEQVVASLGGIDHSSVQLVQHRFTAWTPQGVAPLSAPPVGRVYSTVRSKMGIGHGDLILSLIL